MLKYQYGLDDMHIQKLTIDTNSPIPQLSYTKKRIKNTQYVRGCNPAFCQAKTAELNQRHSKLFKTYLRHFASELKEYEASGSAILQPQMIPDDILETIAQNELSKMRNFPSEHKLYIITGRIGGGKSTFVKENQLQKLFYTPDADEIKLLLPGYNQFGSSYVHKASCTINSANISEALKQGINTVIQTATTINNLDDIIDEALDYNYKDITMIHIDTAEDIALKRAEIRGKLTGRDINPKIITERKYIDDIVPTFTNPNRGLSHLIVYNNNGASPLKVKNITLHSWLEVLTYVTESDD